jgi:hypothetical protein
MRFQLSLVTVALAALLAASAAFAVPSRTAAASAQTVSAADLRVTLDSQLGEHALLAIQTAEAGYSGSKQFPALAKQLDRNSVALSTSIGSVFGAKAGNQFLNGKFLWRDHIRFFVAYTVAKAKHDPAGQKRALVNLSAYTAAFSKFLAGATGLPQPALASGLGMHLMHLKGAVDAYAAGNYAKAASIQHTAYTHMVMTGDLLAGAIVQKFPGKFGM